MEVSPDFPALVPVAMKPLQTKRRVSQDLDEGVIADGALYCAHPDCGKVYLAGRSHASAFDHAQCVSKPTMEQWHRRCNGSSVESGIPVAKKHDSIRFAIPRQPINGKRPV